MHTSANGIFACLGLGLQKWGAQAGRVLENGSRRNVTARTDEPREQAQSAFAVCHSQVCDFAVFPYTHSAWVAIKILSDVTCTLAKTWEDQLRASFTVNRFKAPF